MKTSSPRAMMGKVNQPQFRPHLKIVEASPLQAPRSRERFHSQRYSPERRQFTRLTRRRIYLHCPPHLSNLRSKPLKPSSQRNIHSPMCSSLKIHHHPHALPKGRGNLGLLAQICECLSRRLMAPNRLQALPAVVHRYQGFSGSQKASSGHLKGNKSARPKPLSSIFSMCRVKITTITHGIYSTCRAQI